MRVSRDFLSASRNECKSTTEWNRRWAGEIKNLSSFRFILLDTFFASSSLRAEMRKKILARFRKVSCERARHHFKFIVKAQPLKMLIFLPSGQIYGNERDDGQFSRFMQIERVSPFNCHLVQRDMFKMPLKGSIKIFLCLTWPSHMEFELQNFLQKVFSNSRMLDYKFRSRDSDFHKSSLKEAFASSLMLTVNIFLPSLHIWLRRGLR